MEVELDLFNYASKSDLKGETDINTSEVAKKTDLAGWKSDNDKLDNEKLETDPVYLTELSDLVKYEVVKKGVYDELV